MNIIAVFALSSLLLRNLPTSPSPSESAAMQGMAETGIKSCALGSDGGLSAIRTTPTGQGVRYVFFDKNNKWIGEQWEIGAQYQPPDSHVLASAESIERADIYSMGCAFLSANQFQYCGLGFNVDEGADINIASILITPSALSARFMAFYNNFFSKGDFKVHNQLYFVQLDSRSPIEPIVTNTKSQDLVFRFVGVKPGRHSLSYGLIIPNEMPTLPADFGKLEQRLCFTSPIENARK